MGRRVSPQQFADKILTESGKSFASITRGNKQREGTCIRTFDMCERMQVIVNISWVMLLGVAGSRLLQTKNSCDTMHKRDHTIYIEKRTTQ